MGAICKNKRIKSWKDEREWRYFMQFSGVAGGLYRVGNWIILLGTLNVLWIIFSLLGLIVFGLFPSTVAMYTVVRQCIRGKNDLPIFRTYWESYRSNFLKANALGLTLFIIAYLIYIDFIFLNTLTGWPAILLNVILISALILFSVVMLLIFPVFVHYELRILQYIKVSIVIGISYPIQTLFILLSAVFIYAIVIIIPGLFLFFGSILSFFIMWISNITFGKIEAKKNLVKRVSTV